MITDNPGVGPLWTLTSPACRVICSAGTDEIKSVAVWRPGYGYGAIRPDRAELDVLRGFARQVAGEIVASARPAGTGAGGAGVGAAVVGGANLPAEGAELLSIVQELTDPRLLICRAVRAEPPGVRRAPRARLRDVGRPAWYRRVPPYRPGRGDLPGRGDPPGRGGPPAR